MAAGSDTRRGYAAEDIVAELFSQLGYVVHKNIRVAGIEVDLVVHKNGLRSPVEVKARPLKLSELRLQAVRLRSLQDIEGFGMPIIVVVGKISPAAKDWAQQQFNLQVWDIDVLHTKARPYDKLYQEIKEFESDHRITQAEPSQDLEKCDEVTRLIGTLQNHEDNGGLTAHEYERLCLEVFAFLFDPDLYGFQTQTETSDGGNRYDFVCRIRNGNAFWDSVRTDFRTRSIIFECKNYESLITADQLYSTERYLFSGALRTVCFLISRKGADEGCRRAAQGALRESGKLVLLLSNRDLIAMLRLKPEEDGPTSYLDEKIWQFITTVPR